MESVSSYVSYKMLWDPGWGESLISENVHHADDVISLMQFNLGDRILATVSFLSIKYYLLINSKNCSLNLGIFFIFLTVVLKYFLKETKMWCLTN